MALEINKLLSLRKFLDWLNRYWKYIKRSSYKCVSRVSMQKIKWGFTMNEKEEQFLKVHNLMVRLIGKENHNHRPETIRELFNLHNSVTGVMEYSVSCGGCRKRVYNRLKDWYYNNRENYKHLID